MLMESLICAIVPLVSHLHELQGKFGPRAFMINSRTEKEVNMKCEKADNIIIKYCKL